MTTLVVLTDFAIFAAGILVTLSWRKIRAWLGAEESTAAAAAKAEAAKLAADVTRKL